MKGQGQHLIQARELPSGLIHHARGHVPDGVQEASQAPLPWAALVSRPCTPSQPGVGTRGPLQYMRTPTASFHACEQDA